MTTSLYRFLLAPLLVSCLAGCATAPGIDIAAEAASVEVVRGASTALAVTLTRTGGATADVQLELVGLPEHVAGSFSPMILSGPVTAATLTLEVDPAATAGTHDFKVLATGSGLAAETDVALTVSDLDLTGTVYLVDGRPWAGIGVEGPTGSTTTASDGTFSLSGLAVPYDLTLHSDAFTNLVHVFEGLTSAEPVLQPMNPLTVAFLGDTADLSGNLSGPGMPLPANHAARVCLEGIDSTAYACQALAAGEDSYDVMAVWPAATTIEARVHVLAYELNAAGNAPAAYVGYGSAEVTLSAGDVIVLDVALEELPATTTLTGQVAVEGGGSPDRVYAGLRLGPNLTIPLFGDGSGAAHFAMPMPVLPGASYDVVAVDGAPSRLAWRSGSDAVAGTLVIPLAPTLLAPDDAAAGVDLATTFELTAPAPSVVTYVWNGGGAAPTYALTTSSPSAAIPDGAAFAFPLPPATAYEWYALRVRADRVDAATHYGYADAVGALEMMSTKLGGRGFSSAGAMARSASRTFTTAP